MSKIDKESLVAEIKRLQDINSRDADNGCDEDQCCGYGYCLEDILRYINSLQQEQQEVDLEDKVTFDCISKKVTMTVRELINYYIDRECCDVADECGF